MRYSINTELSEIETYLIGSIVSQWGFLESDIFAQTFQSFKDGEEIPASIKKNVQFSQALDLWLKRVVEIHGAEEKSVLTEQYEKIKSHSDFRQAIVHSRWEWEPDAPNVITAERVHKETIKRVSFTAEDIREFAESLGEIRFFIRYPVGLEDRAKEMGKSSGHITRPFWDLLSGRAQPDDLTNGQNKE